MLVSASPAPDSGPAELLPLADPEDEEVEEEEEENRSGSVEPAP